MDIENTADLSAESRTKLVQAKSKGLTHTLITEALTSGKCWDDIKDIPHLKLCNADIHTSVSHFMDIQQKEKESLAVYIHYFKGEAKQCNFTYSTTTIRIFVKRLRNNHTIAARVYEKGPPTQAEVISDVEKLQAAQQLTPTLLPSSTLNVMSHEEDRCFQCEESGHIACNCPNVHWFKCDEYGHIVVDCPHQIPPSGMPACHHRPNPIPGTTPDQLLVTITRTDTDIVDQDHSPILTDIAVTVAMIHTEDIPGHIIETIDITTGVLHNVSTPVIIVTPMTPHITDCLHTGAHQSTLGIRADHIPIQHTNKVSQALHKSSMHPSRPQDKSHHKRSPRVMTDDLQTDFYSSEDNSSDSEDDWHHLNQRSPLSVVHSMNGGQTQRKLS